MLCLALASGVSTSCAGGSTSSSEGVADSPFAGSWEPVDASFDITWGAGSRSYGLVAGGTGGGLEVSGGDAELAVTLVGKSGVRSDALPATAEGKALSFSIPISEEMPTGATLTSTGEGLAELTLEGQDNVWSFRKTENITLED